MKTGIKLNDNWIFKYGDIKHIEDTIIKNTLGFSKISAFNDPFEIAHTFYYNRKDKSKDWNNEKFETFRKEKSEYLNNVEISCFSRTPSEPLMWSHYSEKHYGVCYCFDEAELSYFGLCSSFGDINYSNQLPVIYYDEDVTLNYRWQSELNKILMTKSLHWAYEKEYRLVLKSGVERKFNVNSLKAVILGHKASIWHKKRILDTINKANETREQKIEIYYACLSTEKYEIVIEKEPSQVLSENTTILV